MKTVKSIVRNRYKPQKSPMTFGMKMVSSRPRTVAKPKTVRGVSSLLSAMEYPEPVNLTYTENGAITPSTTGSCVLDFFARGGSMRASSESEIVDLFKTAFDENASLALRALFYFRDVRAGQGERRLFRVLLRYLAHKSPQSIRKNLGLIVEFGRYDDLFELLGTGLEPTILTFVNNQLVQDLQAERPSLLAKWMFSENTSSKESRRKAAIIRNFLGISSREYRKMLSELRAKIGVLETKLCDGNWQHVNYEHVPSCAGIKYRKAFSKHDAARYVAYLESVKKGEKKINTQVLYPHDIVSKLISQNSWRHEVLYDESLSVMWNNLPNYLEGAKGNRLVVADVSGSMLSKSGSVRPIDVSVALAIYFAERNEGKFKNYFITFTDSPTLVKINKGDISDKVKAVFDAGVGYNTDLQAVFDSLLNTAKKFDIPKRDMPVEIYIISDGQFDIAEGNYRTNLEAIKAKYKRAGYPVPHVISWNVNGSYNNQFATKDEDGITLISGYSPSVLKSLLSAKTVTPMDGMLEVLNSNRYRFIYA